MDADDDVSPELEQDHQDKPEKDEHMGDDATEGEENGQKPMARQSTRAFVEQNDYNPERLFDKVTNWLTSKTAD